MATLTLSPSIGSSKRNGRRPSTSLTDRFVSSCAFIESLLTYFSVGLAIVLQICTRSYLPSTERGCRLLASTTVSRSPPPRPCTPSYPISSSRSPSTQPCNPVSQPRRISATQYHVNYTQPSHHLPRPQCAFFRWRRRRGHVVALPQHRTIGPNDG